MFSNISPFKDLFINRINIFLGILLFSGLNIFSKKYIPDFFIKKDRVFQYHTYIYSTIHSFMISIACILYLFNYINVNLTSFFIDLSLGYTIFDLTVILSNTQMFDWKGTLIHHIAMLLLLSGRELFFDEVAIGLLSEISTIFLNLSWILYQSNKTDTKIFKIISILVLVSYFFTRVLNFPYLTYIAIIVYNLHPIFYTMILSLTVINIYWFKLLFAKALNVNKTKKITDKEN